MALSLWPYFGAPLASESLESAEDADVTGKVPRLVRVFGKEFRVQSWVDVAVVTMEAIAELGAEELGAVVEDLPKFANLDATAFRRSSRLKRLSNGGYVETNLSASAIHRLCQQAVLVAGFGPDDWTVECIPRPKELPSS